MSKSNLAVAQQPSQPLWGRGAAELAELIRSREVSAEEVLAAFIARLEEVNPALNAVVFPRLEEAQKEALAADRKQARGEPLGLLHGVPVTIKECLDVVGTPSTFGIESRKDHRATVDNPYVARWREAGAVVLGKTNVAQLLMFLESANPLYGRSNNPWDLARTPGGSSGGEAAALAAGFSALGMGTDIGGSIRAPAAMCGLTSLKPTMGRLPDPGRFSIPFGQQAIPSQTGIMGHRVADVQLGLEVAHGGPLAEAKPFELSRLTVGVFDDDSMLTVSPAVKRAVKQASELLRAAGVNVVPFAPPNVPEAMTLFFSLLAGDGGAGFKRALGSTKRDPRIAQFESLSGGPLKRALLGLILGATGRGKVKPLLEAFAHSDTDTYWLKTERLHDWRTEFTAACDAQRLDALLCPAFGLPALKHGASQELGLVGMYTALFNVLGWPAGISPLTRVAAGEETVREPGKDLLEKFAKATEEGSAGLPIGVQLVARPWREDVALGLMAELERAASGRPDYPRLPVTPVK